MQRQTLGILSAAHFFTDLNLGSLPAILPFLMATHGFDYKSVAGLVFASSCLSTFVQPLFGWLADRSDRHRFMGAGLMLTGLSFGLIGVLDSYWAIFCTVILAGVGSAVFHPEAAKMTNLMSGDRRGIGMSIFSVGGNAGFGVGPLLAVALIGAFGLRGLLFFALLGVLIGLPLMLTSSRFAIPSTSSVGTHAARSASSEAPNDWRAFGVLTVFIILRSICFTGVISFLPLFCVHALHLSMETAGTTVSVLAFSGAVFTLFGGWWADRFGHLRMIKLGSLLLIPAVALAVVFESPLWVWLMLVPISLAFNMTYSPFVVLGQTYLARNIGFASGITLGISFSAGGLLAPALGWYGDEYGIMSVMVLIIGLAVLGALSAFLLRDPGHAAPVSSART